MIYPILVNDASRDDEQVCSPKRGIIYKKVSQSYPLLTRGMNDDDEQAFKVSMQYLIWLLTYVTQKITLTFTLTE